MNIIRGKNTKRRRELFRLDPHCYWCGRLTSFFIPPEGMKPPSSCATVDHILSRNVAQDYFTYRSRKNTVLACHGCNQQRNNIEQKKLKPQKIKLDATNPLREFCIEEFTKPIIYL